MADDAPAASESYASPAGAGKLRARAASRAGDLAALRHRTRAARSASPGARRARDLSARCEQADPALNRGLPGERDSADRVAVPRNSLVPTEREGLDGRIVPGFGRQPAGIGHR